MVEHMSTDLTLYSRSQRKLCCLVLRRGQSGLVLLFLQSTFLLNAQLGCQHLSPIGDPQELTNNPAKNTSVRVSSGEVDPYPCYFFAYSAEARRKFIANVTMINLGDSTDAIIEKLGKPDDDAEGGLKSLVRRQHRRRVLTYRIAKYRKDLVTTRKDQDVDLWFDANDRLELISSTFSGVAERETPDAMKNDAQPGWWKFWKREGN